jgi:hypothetical protein
MFSIPVSQRTRKVLGKDRSLSKAGRGLGRELPADREALMGPRAVSGLEVVSTDELCVLIHRLEPHFRLWRGAFHLTREARGLGSILWLERPEPAWPLTENFTPEARVRVEAMSQYRDLLVALSQRTKTPVSSLIASFAVLHEVTAVFPLVAFFYVGRWGGLGEGVVRHFTRQYEKSLSDGQLINEEAWMTRKCREWVSDGEHWAGRVGRRYGVFGFKKGEPAAGTTNLRTMDAGADIAGDVANAIFAYAATKACFDPLITIRLIICEPGSLQAILPLRIGACLYLSPAFARSVVDPLRRRFSRNLYRGS